MKWWDQNCGVGADFWKSLGQQGNPTKGNQSWIFIGKTDAEAETPIFWSPDTNSHYTGKKPWCWERLRTEKEAVRVCDGWMASLMQWTWTWANSGRWWGTGRTDVLQPMGSQRVGHYWMTEQQQYIIIFSHWRFRVLNEFMIIIFPEKHNLYMSSWNHLSTGPSPL